MSHRREASEYSRRRRRDVSLDAALAESFPTAEPIHALLEPGVDGEGRLVSPPPGRASAKPVQESRKGAEP